MRFLLFPFLAIAIWAGNVVVSKMASGAISPLAITFYRLALAISIMSVFIAAPAWKNRAVIKQYWPKLMFLGFLSMAFYQCLSYWAADTSTATNMAIITALTPLLTMLVSSLVLREYPTIGMVLGGGIALWGTAYLISGGAPLELIKGNYRLGDVLMLTAALSYAFYSVLLRKWKIAVPAWQSTYMQAISALVFMLPLFLWVPTGQAVLDASTVPLILYAGILASVVLPFFWIKGIEHLGPNRCSVFMNLLPVMTAGLAIVLLDEQLKTYHLLGGGIALLGVFIAQTWRGRIFHRTSARVVGR
ncbi:DMT family transporter [Paenalcaligenes suwonensis]|uniref:DMT family transporter n=1 Tax=Paenalcaligenes suwonensis TaxID=1202713 RepID=UPI00140D3110|nr:DMT family transporter [Paenalcaligenes suwonensis]NHC61881.1 DMT family transporter [Paenalcaligenes suwonensis]